MWLEASYTDEGKYIPGKEFLVNDTIGFIRELPPQLIDAFKSTLEDSIESDLLLHVVDASDPKVEEKIAVVDDILEKIGASQKKIYVFNKMDMLNAEQREEILEKFSDFSPLCISTLEKEGIDVLKEEVLKNFL